MRLLILAAAGWVFYTLVAGDHGYLRIRELESEKLRLDDEIRMLETEVASVRQRLRETTDDPYQLEKIARERYGLARPDETVYRFSRDEFAPRRSPSEAVAPTGWTAGADGSLDIHGGPE
jgi:cell division protein FtsB